MKYEVKIPTVGESITEATIGQWMKKNGEMVKRNDVLMSIETDKASVEVVAENDGVLTITTEQGKPIPIGTVVGMIDSEGKASVASAASASAASSVSTTFVAGAKSSPQIHADLKNHLSPAVQKMVTEKNLDPQNIVGTGRGGRLTKENVAAAGGASEAGSASQAKASQSQEMAWSKMPIPSSSSTVPVGKIPALVGATSPTQKRVPMTTIRKRIAERLVQSQQSTATLTTFNEIDMSRVMAIRSKYKDSFKEKFGVGLGFMGFFVKACVEGLKAFPLVNGFVDGTDVIHNNYYNVGVAVGTEKGLIVPVIKDVDRMSVAQIEGAIRDFAVKAREGKISIDDLNHGTFTISNGGVYGSLLSTPILNPPQSGILGMHKIEDRAVVIAGKIEVRPMMYLALSYDHRIVDGKEAVSFLVKVKEGIEDPERLLLEI